MNPDQKSAALDMTAQICAQFEGFKSEPYLCPAGVWTIGHGITRYPDGRRVTKDDDPITEQKSLEIMRGLLIKFQADVLWHCPSITSTGLLAACTDLAYNIGSNAFGGSTLRKVINDGGDNEAIAAQFRRWNKGGGKVLPGLVRRREAEIAIL